MVNIKAFKAVMERYRAIDPIFLKEEYLRRYPTNTELDRELHGNFDPSPKQECRNCAYYCGQHNIVCAVHPFGQENCKDYEARSKPSHFFDDAGCYLPGLRSTPEELLNQSLDAARYTLAHLTHPVRIQQILVFALSVRVFQEWVARYPSQGISYVYVHAASQLLGRSPDNCSLVFLEGWECSISPEALEILDDRFPEWRTAAREGIYANER